MKFSSLNGLTASTMTHNNWPRWIVVLVGMLAGLYFLPAITSADHADTRLGYIDNIGVSLVSEPFAPFNMAQPSNQTSTSGGTAAFPVTSEGTSPFAYQWLCTGAKIADAANATRVFTNIQLSNAGSYAVTVSNSAESTVSSNAMLAVNPVPGQKLWEFASGGDVFGSPAIGFDGTVYVGSGSGTFYALNPDTGAKIWQYPVGAAIFSSPAIDNAGVIYFGSNNRKVYALDSKDGTKKWEFTTGNFVTSSPAVGQNGHIYVGSYDGKVYALNAMFGEKVWDFLTGSEVSSSPALGENGILYIGSHDGKLYALDQDTGTKKWEFPTGGLVASSPAIDSDGTVFFASDDRKIYALDGLSGAKKWEFSTTAWSRSSPTIGNNGLIYVGSSDNSFYALDKTNGSMRWKITTGHWVPSSAAICVDGTVYIASYDSKLYALDGDTGSQKWAFQSGGLIQSSPTLGLNGILYIGSSDTKVYAIHAANTLAQTPWPKYRNNIQNTGAKVIQGPPTFLYDLTDQSGAIGESLTLQVHATGSQPLFYRWFFNGLTIENATNRMLTIGNLQTVNAGNYYVAISNSLGMVTSHVATIKAGYKLEIGIQGGGSVLKNPDKKYYESGSTVELTAMALPGQPFLGWIGIDAASTNENPLHLTITNHFNLTAAFWVVGQKQWEYVAGSAVFSSPALADNGTIFVGSGNGLLHAINSTTGARIWAFQTGASVLSSPTIGDNNKVYFGSNDRKIYSVDVITGLKKWEYATGDLVASSPALGVTGILYIGSYDRYLYAIDTRNGQMVWKFLTGGSISSSPAVGNDNTVFVGSHDGLVYALDGFSGSKKWEYATGSMVAANPSIGDNGMIYVGSENGNLYALDYATGKQKWIFHATGWFRAGVTIGPDATVYFGSSNGHFYAIDGQTGEMKWDFFVGAWVAPAAALSADGVLYFGAHNNKVYAIDAKNGAKRWEFATGDYVLCSPTIASNGTVYVGSDDGKLYAFSGTQGLANSPWPKNRNNLSNTGSKVVQGTGPVKIWKDLIDQSAVIGQPIAMSVFTSGNPPLIYQWYFENNALNAETNALLTIPAFSLNNVGRYFVVVSNELGAVTSAVARLTPIYPPAAVWLGSFNGTADQTITVPVTLVANGNENALGFSVNFNSAALAFEGIELANGVAGGSLLVNTNQLGSGKIGIALALPSGVTFSAGTQEVVVMSFAAVVLNRSTATSLTFGDVPTVRQLSDAQANVLQATYASGTVNLAAGNYDADVSPRPGGDKAVTITDWVLIGRYVARLDYPTNATEFQRADCAPRSTQGDGLLKVSDWVQAGRYAAGLDPLNAQGGPTSEVAPLDMQAKALGAASRLVPAAPAINHVTLANATISQGQGGLMAVTLEAQGTENAIGFSLAFDPAALRFGGASLGGGAEGATLHVNTRLLSSGKVGFALALPTGRTFGAGDREVLKLSFRAISPRPGPSRVVFADQPVQRSVADAVANDVSAAYLDGAITVQESVPAVKITRVGTGVALSWPTWAGRFVLQVADQNAPALIWSQVTETPVISDEETVVTVPLAEGAKLYRLLRQ